jgi:hypothetical protein
MLDADEAVIHIWAGGPGAGNRPQGAGSILVPLFLYIIPVSKGNNIFENSDPSLKPTNPDPRFSLNYPFGSIPKSPKQAKPQQKESPLIENPTLKLKRRVLSKTQ